MRIKRSLHKKLFLVDPGTIFICPWGLGPSTVTFDSSWFTDEGLRFGASGTGRRSLERGRGFRGVGFLIGII